MYSILWPGPLVWLDRKQGFPKLVGVVSFGTGNGLIKLFSTIEIILFSLFLWQIVLCQFPKVVVGSMQMLSMSEIGSRRQPRAAMTKLAVWRKSVWPKRVCILRNLNHSWKEEEGWGQHRISEAVVPVSPFFSIHSLIEQFGTYIKVVKHSYNFSFICNAALVIQKHGFFQ